MDNWWTNKSFWGAIFLIIAMVAKYFGIEILPDEQQTGVDLIVTLINAAIALIGFIMLIIDRVQKVFKKEVARALAEQKKMFDK